MLDCTISSVIALKNPICFSSVNLLKALYPLPLTPASLLKNFTPSLATLALNVLTGSSNDGYILGNAAK